MEYIRIKVEFISDNNIILPIGFNKYIQALIYNMFSQKLRKFIHENGFESFSKRVYRFFTFSSILERGKYYKKMKIFNFGNKISFYISSPINEILEDILNNLFEKDRFSLGENILYLSSVISLGSFYTEKNIINIKMLTPLEVHKTEIINNKKKTIYYSPFSAEFEELINLNLKHKWEAFYNKELKESIKIIPLFNENKYKKIVYYGLGDKKYIIEGWMGNYKMKGDPKIIKFLYDVGLGSKNSQGFGMFEVLRE
ncbi:CRISPR-associated endoribonuclease Cas6 [Marinitoga piezophila KA3]|uniref:CRISPR-associated endoribonuclease n=1 Tax=Marinitoga piezophila (strain DSM 14283 / JCM 11233 / KA3) TaxID=443254 RepID=H2J3Z6_MARPK|nr:CRISPR-associated endoribonuclease Cas6 [Marinitoga piezophila]AEX84724.1 CRISPR-associated endoribonuclease Cas6 [Marinitoga piezophila KA3]